jgi:hypothetical protein
MPYYVIVSLIVACCPAYLNLAFRSQRLLPGIVMHPSNAALRAAGGAELRAMCLPPRGPPDAYLWLLRQLSAARHTAAQRRGVCSEFYDLFTQVGRGEGGGSAGSFFLEIPCYITRSSRGGASALWKFKTKQSMLLPFLLLLDPQVLHTGLAAHNRHWHTLTRH